MIKLITPSTYQGIVEYAGSLIQDLEVTSLRSYWQIGQVVLQFDEAQTRGAYDGKTIQDLARDLQARGHLRDQKDPARYLRLARDLRVKFAEDKVEQFIKNGITLSHVRHLAEVDQSFAAEVESRLFRADGKVPSTRQFKELCEDANAAAAREAREVQTRPGGPAGALPDGASYMVQETTGNPDLPTPPPAPRSETASKPKDRAQSLDSAPVSPLRALKAMDKLLEGIIGKAGETLEAVSSGDKNGFDSEKAQKNYRMLRSNVLSGMRGVIQTLKELVPLLEAGQEE